MNFGRGFMWRTGMSPPPIGPRRTAQAISGFIRPRDLLCVLAFGMLAGRAGAQAPTVDTSVPGLPGSSTSLLGPMPGAGGGSFGNLPGAGGILGGRAGVSAPKGVPTTVTTPGVGTRTDRNADGDLGAPAATGRPRLRRRFRIHSKFRTARRTTDRPTA